jgi:uncharacterized damage-inducible protein DinB
MTISSIKDFISYLEKTRTVTNKVIQAIPASNLDWTYMPGKFSIADLIRHIAAIERNVFAEVIINGKPNYKGCGKDIADGYENVIAYFNKMHIQSVEIFSNIPDEALKRKIKSLDGKEIEVATFLRALVVHEIHHRGALCIYLNLLGITTPSVIGLREEEVIQLSK